MRRVALRARAARRRWRGSLGLVHRDVTPSNLFATTAGVVKVLDFGIAKVRGSTTETEAGMVKGKAQYMAPEQLLGGAVDRRCDVFMLGIVLFELATGTRLFARDSDYLARAMRSSKSRSRVPMRSIRRSCRRSPT